jgi:hypothetical protein
MQHLQAFHVFHEKMTFDYRFVHACCKLPPIVGNGTRGCRCFAIRTAAIQCASGKRSNFETGLKEDSIGVVSPVTVGL